MPVLQHPSRAPWIRTLIMLLLVGVLLFSNSATANAQGQTTNPLARQVPPDGLSTPVPQADQAAGALTAPNIVKDPSFEASYGSRTYWGQSSENFGSPVCTTADCGDGDGTARPRSGSVWAWFGGVDFSKPGTSNPEGAMLSQQVRVPSCGATLRFYLWIGAAEAGSDSEDVFWVRLAGTRIFMVDATDKSAYSSYKLVTINLTQDRVSPGQEYLYFGAIVSDQLVTFNLDDVTVTPNCLVISGNAGAEGATINYTGGSTTTDYIGRYSFNVPVGWSGTVTPSRSGYIFSPASKSYSNVTTYLSEQNYTAIRLYTISGNTGVGGVTLSYNYGGPKTVTSQPNGSYSFKVPHGWSGTVTPSKPGYSFSPAKRTYTNVTANQAVQDYTVIYTISGNAGVGGVTLHYTDVMDKTVASQADGSYSLNVSSGWSGMVVPMHPCFTFEPTEYIYSDVAADQTAQDFVTSFNTSAGCSDVALEIGGAPQGRFGLLTPRESTRASFANVNAGPVKIESTNALPLMAAERLIYKVGGVNTSFTETMALPNKQLDTTYWLPWYNNNGVDLDTQLRLANVTEQDAMVHIFIGENEMTPAEGMPLRAGESTRVSYSGVNDGPVQIVSDQHIVAAERLIYKVNNLATSFSEMLALPQGQVDKIFWLPWYNNSKDLDTQLRVANVSGEDAIVRLYLGTQELSTCTASPAMSYPYELAAGKSMRVSCAGVNAGPLKIESTQDIVAAERLIYKVGGVAVSFTETMALPKKQLDTTYWLPWYNNNGKDLDTQLRIANVSGLDATVTVTIDGVQMIPIDLLAGESTRINFSNTNDGPVRIVSDQDIVVAERLIYKANNLNTSFSEMMALPASQLDTLYWLPWYNNNGRDLDTQLRFGVP